MASFDYTPLNRRTRSIRLLSFEDDSRSTTGPRLSCLMETFELARCPPFVALSYTWGHPDLCREIIINGKALRVRENLYLALSVLQKMPATQVSRDAQREHELIHRHFWVDAVCINQEDVLERGHQVNLMESIFTGATCVIAWLGIEADESKVAMKAISSQLRTYAERRRASRGGKNAHRNEWALRSAFDCLSCRSYWNRMWIVQEFILPKHLLLLCGVHGAWWEDVVASKPAILEMMLLQPGWLKLWDARERWQHSNSHHGDVERTTAHELGDDLEAPASGTKSSFTGANSLDELLFAFIYAQCSDARDRVYALLSLVRNRGSHSSRSLLPDYTISAEQLYYRVLSHLRYSPSLAEHKPWTRFRGALRHALDLDPDEMSFHLHDALYQVTGSISWQRMAASFESYEEFQYRFFIWRQSLEGYGDLESFQQFQYRKFLWRQSLKGYNLFDSDTPLSSHRKLTTLFRTFPRNLDPQAWHDFDNLARAALGIPGLPLPEFFTSIPGLTQVIDRYSRETQATYRDKVKWDAFSISHKAIPRQQSEAHRNATGLLVSHLERTAMVESSTHAPQESDSLADSPIATYRQQPEVHETPSEPDAEQLLDGWIADIRTAMSRREPGAHVKTPDSSFPEAALAVGPQGSIMKQFRVFGLKTQFYWRFRPTAEHSAHAQDKASVKHSKVSLSSCVASRNPCKSDAMSCLSFATVSTCLYY